jgi:hypothetical protein
MSARWDAAFLKEEFGIASGLQAVELGRQRLSLHGTTGLQITAAQKVVG